MKYVLLVQKKKKTTYCLKGDSKLLSSAELSAMFMHSSEAAYDRVLLDVCWHAQGFEWRKHGYGISSKQGMHGLRQGTTLQGRGTLLAFII